MRYKKNEPWHAQAGKRIWTRIPSGWKRSHMERYRGEGSNVFFTWVLVEFSVLFAAIFAVATLLFMTVSKPEKPRIEWNVPFVSATVGVPFSVSVYAHTETAVSVRLHIPETVTPAHVPKTYDSETRTAVLFPGEPGESFLFTYTGDVMTSDALVVELFEGTRVYRDVLPIHADTGMVTVALNPTETNWECVVKNIGRVAIEDIRVDGQDFSYEISEVLPGKTHTYVIPDSVGMSVFDIDDRAITVSGTAYGSELLLHNRYPEVKYSETDSEYVRISFEDKIYPGVETTMRILFTNAHAGKIHDTQVTIFDRYQDLFVFGKPDVCGKNSYVRSDFETAHTFFFGTVPEGKTVACDVPVRILEYPSVTHTAHLKPKFPVSFRAREFSGERKTIRDSFAVSVDWIDEPEQCVRISSDGSILTWAVLNRYVETGDWSYTMRIREAGGLGNAVISIAIPDTIIEPDYSANEVRWSGSSIPAGAGYSVPAFTLRIPVEGIGAETVIEITDVETGRIAHTYTQTDAHCGAAPVDLVY